MGPADLRPARLAHHSHSSLLWKPEFGKVCAGICFCLLHHPPWSGDNTQHRASTYFVYFKWQEALRLNDEMEEEEEEETNNEAAVPQEELDDAELQLQQEGAFSILVSNIFLFFSSVFPEGLHLRV